MAFVATTEQKAIIEADPVSQQVIACAGSGKTATAVRRLKELRGRLGTARGYVALLSYSNVAVDTFREEYNSLAKSQRTLSNRVAIQTVDSFITSNILLPHAARTMGCDRQPFLVRGGEPFLNSFKVFNGEHNVDIEHVHVSLDGNGELAFSESSRNGPRKTVAPDEARKAIHRLGKFGAYTYELGRYWALSCLVRQDRLLRILACRYPYILVDEAQDVGSMHGALLSALMEAGSTVSLLGDPNQAIFEFADADGGFLRSYASEPGCLVQPLTENRRSVEPIVQVANLISGTNSKAIRDAPQRKHGAFLLRYKTGELDKLLSTFSAILTGCGYAKSEAAVLCRGNTLVERLVGGAEEVGRGATKRFACAAIARDRAGDIAAAFEHTVDGVLRVLKGAPETLKRDTIAGRRDALPRTFRRHVWQFLKAPDSGLPYAGRDAKSQWLVDLKVRLPALLDALERDCGLTRLPTWRQNVTAADVGDGPLLRTDLAEGDVRGLAIRTVHMAKGESIGAVLYVAKTADANNLLAGPGSEEGRIGYVAITRACDLLVLAVPSTAPAAAVAALEAKGFMLWE
jgi:superfamily I DNA/RNA helicase